jgi:hypothetical protein
MTLERTLTGETPLTVAARPILRFFIEQLIAMHF